MQTRILGWKKHMTTTVDLRLFYSHYVVRRMRGIKIIYIRLMYVDYSGKTIVRTIKSFVRTMRNVVQMVKSGVCTVKSVVYTALYCITLYCIVYNV